MDVSIIPPATQVLVTAGQGKRFAPRAGAYLIDTLFNIGINYLVAFCIGIFLGFSFQVMAPVIGRYYYLILPESRSTLLDYAVAITITVIYFTTFEWLYGRSLGKVILRMQVVSSDGSACSLTQTLIRGLYRLIDGLFFGVVAYTNMKVPTYQRLGDKKAQTIVVSTNDPIIQTKPAWWRFLIALVVFLCLRGLITILTIMPYLRYIPISK
jgi:uncharacterized RDD family membrane protein YckC